MDRKKLIEALDSLCWSARRYGHDDYGLDWAVDYDGNDIEADEGNGYFHSEAVAVADELLKEWSTS